MKGLIKGMLAHFDIRIVRNSYFESLKQKLHLQFEIIKNDMITCKASPTTKIKKFIKRFRENYISVDLIRIGGDADGGYLIPDIFDRIAYCLSPGVANTADFEVELSRRYGIKSFMIDGSVASAPFADDNFHFTKKFLGHRTNGDFITLSDWMESTLDAGRRRGDHGMILQMDIEGGEYDVLTFESTATLGRFAAMIHCCPINAE